MKATNYNQIDWEVVSATVLKLQQRIAIAYLENNVMEVQESIRQLVKSFSARAMAIRKVTASPGRKTPGVDGETWDDSTMKFEAVQRLKNLSNYKAKPVRRVYLPKPQGGLRPLGIPTLFDRAVQSLYGLALSPIAEISADTRSYGFRPFLSSHDAMTYIWLLTARPNNAHRWVLEADIKKFFDRISHEWILEHIPLPRRIVVEFLKAGFMEKGETRLHETLEGTPQGGSISPTLANMVLDGLQEALTSHGMHFVRYADDFLVFCKTHSDADVKARAIVNDFLKPRGLELNEAKTKVTEISEKTGIQFLGFKIREYPDATRKKGNVLLITPQKEKVALLLAKTKMIFRHHRSKSVHRVMSELNPVLRGWANYFRTGVSKKIFSFIGYKLFSQTKSYLLHKYRGVPVRKLMNRHFHKVGQNRWVLKSFDPERGSLISLFQIASVGIQRSRIVPWVNPYLVGNEALWSKPREKRVKPPIVLNKRKQLLFSRQKALCTHCKQLMDPLEEVLEEHHMTARIEGGGDELSNLRLLHRVCHLQLTNKWRRQRKISALLIK